jgi:hypothetical protein
MTENESKMLEMFKELACGEPQYDQWNDTVGGYNCGTVISTAMNTFGIHYDELVDALRHPDVCQVFRSVAYAWIKTLQAMYSADRYDGRNEYSATVASKLVNTMAFAKHKDATTWDGNPTFRELSLWAKRHNEWPDVGGIVAYQMMRQHRTLQQSWSGVVFRFLVKDFNEAENKEVEQAMADVCYDPAHWWHTPMI